MKEHPILFSGPMVRAIIDGRKTQTRRVLIGAEVAPRRYIGAYGFLAACPYGVVGDRLWVREAFAAGFYPTNEAPRDNAYRADYASIPLHEVPDVRWTPSIHMPRWASRIDLEITRVRLERLSSITDEDLINEGVLTLEERLDCWAGRKYTKARAKFEALWDEINGKRIVGGNPIRWADNPWVWAISFKVVRIAGREVNRAF